MKYSLRPLPLFLCSLCGITASALPTDTTYVYLTDGAMHAYPAEMVEEQLEVHDSLVFLLKGGLRTGYPLSRVEHLGAAPTGTIRFSSFKFNNKYNEQLPVDVQGAIDTDGNVTATVGAIGKRLTPSFSTLPAEAEVFVDTLRQFSKRSRLRFAAPVTYTLTRPGYRVMTYSKTKDEVWSLPVEEVTEAPIALTAGMLSTNAPSNYSQTEGLDKMIDGNPSTFFHSTWGTGSYDKLPLEQHPYIQIDLSDELSQFRFSYTTRPDNADRMPLALLVQTSTDGRTWSDLRTLTAEADGLPVSGLSATYTSPTMKAAAPFRHLRLTMTAANYKNYLCLAELSLARVTSVTVSDSVLISPAQYEYRLRPLGTTATVSVDWPTDAAANVPRIDINIDGGAEVIEKDTYLNASISIDGGGIFPDFSDRVTIKGRGNSTWNYPKKPYRLKFSSAKKPFGLTKGKSWVLLANYQRGSMLTNAIAMKVARMAGTPGANQIIPVELYINGKYRGSYNFTQHVGLSNNSIDEDEETAALFELDTYYDEAFKFRSQPYDLPVNIKDPDMADDPDSTRFNTIRDGFNEFAALVNGDTDAYTKVMDPDFFARYMLVNDVVLNTELKHPKSTFLYRPNIYDRSSRFVWGPVWDFDWGFGYELNTDYYTADPDVDLFSGIHRFFRDIYDHSEQVRRAYSKEWTDFMAQHRDELIEYIDDYYAYARPSLEHDATIWPSVATNYATSAANAKLWLTQRTDRVYARMEHYPVRQARAFVDGDANLDDRVSIGDVVAIYNNLAGRVNENFDFDRADVDVSNSITRADADMVDTIVLATPVAADYYESLPEAQAAFSMQDFTLTEQAQSRHSFQLTTNTAGLSALQFDIRLPRGLRLVNLIKPSGIGGFMMKRLPQADGLTTRVLIAPSTSQFLPKGKLSFIVLLTADGKVPEPDRKALISNAIAATANGTEYRIAGAEASFDLTSSGITQPTAASISVEGGDALTIRCGRAGTLPVYSADGRIVRTVRLAAGENRFIMAPGLYIVAGQKAVVK